MKALLKDNKTDSILRRKEIPDMSEVSFEDSLGILLGVLREWFPPRDLDLEKSGVKGRRRERTN